MEKERRRKKQERRHLEYRDKVRRRHWRVRALTEEQRQEILKPKEEERSRETPISPAMSCSISRRSLAADGLDSTWFVGSDIHHLDSAASNYKDNDGSQDTIVNMESISNSDKV